MADTLKLRGGTTADNAGFTGADREVTVDTTKKTLVVHGDNQAGGFPLMRESGGNAATTVGIGTGGTNAIVIDSNQRVGIGESTMDALLVIKGNSDASTTPSIRLKDGADSREAWISNSAGDLILANGGNDNTPHCMIKMFDGNIIQFNTANSPAMVIDASGNAVVGSTTANGSDACTLNSDGEVRAAGFYFSNNIGSAMSSEGIRRLTTGTIVFDTVSTPRMSIGANGNVDIADGNLVVASGHGIDFSATSDADGNTSELLDDYEEGTHTPTFLNLDVPSHVTVDHFNYTKIGRLVHIEFQFTVSTSINDGSGFRLTLPFGTFGDRNIKIGCVSDKGSGAVPFTFLHDSSGVNIKAITESGGFTTLTYNHFSGCTLIGGGTYETDN